MLAMSSFTFNYQQVVKSYRFGTEHFKLKNFYSRSDSQWAVKTVMYKRYEKSLIADF